MCICTVFVGVRAYLRAELFLCIRIIVSTRLIYRRASNVEVVTNRAREECEYILEQFRSRGHQQIPIFPTFGLRASQKLKNWGRKKRVITSAYLSNP